MSNKPIAGMVACFFLLGVLPGAVFGQDVNSTKGATSTSAIKPPDGGGGNGGTRLAPSCDPNATASLLQVAQDRLGRLQAALGDVRRAQAVSIKELGAGDSLALGSKLTGVAQIAQGFSDGFMGLYGGEAKKLYDLSKRVADCVNAASTGTKTSTDCILGLMNSFDGVLPAWAKEFPLAFAAKAGDAVNKLSEGQTVDAGGAAASAISQQLKYMGSDGATPKTLDRLGKSVAAADLILKGDIEKGAEAVPNAIAQFVKDETLSKAYETTGEVLKAGMGILKGVDNLSAADAEGSNLDKIISSNLKSEAAIENDLIFKIRAARIEVDRLTNCQQQLEAARLSKATNVGGSDKTGDSDNGKVTQTPKSVPPQVRAAGSSRKPAGVRPENSSLNSVLTSLQQALNQLQTQNQNSPPAKTNSAPPSKSTTKSAPCPPPGSCGIH